MATDTWPMRISALIDRLLEQAPTIEVFTLCAALLLAWTGAPVWLPYTLATIVGFLALLLFAARVRRREVEETDDDGARKSWFEQELAGKGTPPGSYVLGFFGFLAIGLTGYQSPYAAPAWAGFVLGIVWGIANRAYPADEEADA